MGRHSFEGEEPIGITGRPDAISSTATSEAEQPVLRLPEAVREAFQAPPPNGTSAVPTVNGYPTWTPPPIWAAEAEPFIPEPAAIPEPPAIPAPPPTPVQAPPPRRPPLTPAVSTARPVLPPPPPPPPAPVPAPVAHVALTAPETVVQPARQVSPRLPPPPPTRLAPAPAPPPPPSVPAQPVPPAAALEMASPPVEEVELLAAAETVRVQDFRAPPMAAESPARPPTPPPPAVRRSTGWVRGLLSWAAVIVVALLISFGLRLFVVESFWIPSPSMEPTLHGCHGCNNDRVLVDKLSYRLHPIRRGDVVVFDRPKEVVDPDKYLIKRVIGIPGDTVSGHDGKVWIGNRPLNEPYLNSKCGRQPPFPATTVPPGKVFVLGDNRCDSFDSRLFGSIPTSTVVGRAFLVIWPISRRHWL